VLVRRSVARGVAIGALLLGTLLWLGTPVFADSDSTKAPDVADGAAARSDASREHKDREHKDKDESKEKGPPDRNSPDDGGVCPP